MKRSQAISTVLKYSAALMFVGASVASAAQMRMKSVGFAAPAINGSSSVPSPELGAIIYDNTAGGFRGYDGSSWLALSPAGGAGGAPNVQIFKTGTAQTYTTPAGAIYLKIRMVGGGGGGSGSGDATTMSPGGNGSDSTFGTNGTPTLITAGGGAGGPSANPSLVGGIGGSYSIGSPASDAGSIQGGNGGGQMNNAGTGNFQPGSAGGANFLGGQGPSSANAKDGNAATANSGGGGGGGGGGSTANNQGGTGGGAGAGVVAVITGTLDTTYKYTVGTKGTSPSTAGANGFDGGDGADGMIVVEAYFQ